MHSHFFGQNIDKPSYKYHYTWDLSKISHEILDFSMWNGLWITKMNYYYIKKLIKIVVLESFNASYS